MVYKDPLHPLPFGIGKPSISNFDLKVYIYIYIPFLGGGVCVWGELKKSAPILCSKLIRGESTKQLHLKSFFDVLGLVVVPASAGFAK